MTFSLSVNLSSLRFASDLGWDRGKSKKNTHLHVPGVCLSES